VLCITDIELRMLSVTTFLNIKMTENNFNISCSKCNSISIIEGVKTEKQKWVTIVDGFYFAKSIQKTLFCN